MRCAMKCIDKFLAPPPPTPIMNRRLEMITENQSDQNNQGDQGDCVCLLKRKRLTVKHIKWDNQQRVTQLRVRMGFTSKNMST